MSTAAPPTDTPAPATPTPALPTATATPWPALNVAVQARAQAWSTRHIEGGVGSTVTWTWSSFVPHNVAVAGVLSGVPVSTQGSQAITFQQPGTFTYICDAHPDTMTGTITIH